jgi:hypothetical protein
MKDTNKFMQLSSLILEIMVEGSIGEDLPADFKMPKKTVIKTAKALRKSKRKGFLKKDLLGEYYYVGIVDDFGGYFEKKINKAIR